MGSWWWRQARWKRVVLLVVAVYVVAVRLNLLVRWALKGWERHPDLWITALISGTSPAIAVPFIGLVQRRVAREEPGSDARR